jgi:thioesterase domain-containing protein/acyl carrier protein
MHVRERANRAAMAQRSAGAAVAATGRSTAEAPADATPLRSATDIELRLMRILREGFDLRLTDPDENFFDLGGDSLLAAGFFARLEMEFGVTLSLDVLLERPTVRLLAELLGAGPQPRVRRSVVTVQSGSARPPLFCLPGIGGNVLEFRRLASRLGPSQPVYGLPPVGLDDGQTPHATIEEMAAHAIAELQFVQPHGPYYLAGYSLGGVVAFEMALQLRAAGESTALLALLDSRLWSPPPVLSAWQRLMLHARTLYGSSNHGRWHYLRERARLLTNRLRRGDLRRAEDDLVEGLQLSESSRRVARVHWQAWRNYRPRVYDGLITLLVAQLHPHYADGAQDVDPTLGWARWTGKPVEVHFIKRTHAEILRMEELDVLSTRLGGGGSDDSASFRATTATSY